MSAEWNFSRPAESFQRFPFPSACGSPTMTGPELLQFEAIRTVAAALISVSIILLWLVAMSGR